MLNMEQMRVQGRLVRHDLGRGIGKRRASSRQNFLEPTKQKHRNPIISQSLKLAPFAFVSYVPGKGPETSICPRICTAWTGRAGLASRAGTTSRANPLANLMKNKTNQCEKKEITKG